MAFFQVPLPDHRLGNTHVFVLGIQQGLSDWRGIRIGRVGVDCHQFVIHDFRQVIPPVGAYRDQFMQLFGLRVHVLLVKYDQARHYTLNIEVLTASIFQ